MRNVTRYVTGINLSYQNMADSLNWYYKEPDEKQKLEQAVQDGDMLEILRLLFFADNQIVFNGEEFVVV